MEISVTRTDGDFEARAGTDVVGRSFAFARPDERWFIDFDDCRQDADAALLRAMAEHAGRDLHITVDESDTATARRLTDLGFTVNRREHHYRVSIDPADTGLTDLSIPDGLRIVTADQADEDRLRELDDELRQDVPGTDGWRWDREGFRAETHHDAYVPELYRVAIDPAADRYAGIARIWVNPSGARLGHIGVTRPYRRRGLATALLAQAFHAAFEGGITELVTEVDVTNTASNGLMADLGARRIGGDLELVRRVS